MAKRKNRTVGDAIDAPIVVRLSKQTMGLLRGVRENTVDELERTMGKTPLSASIIEQYTGPGWQGRIIDLLAQQSLAIPVPPVRKGKPDAQTEVPPPFTAKPKA